MMSFGKEYSREHCESGMRWGPKFLPLRFKMRRQVIIIKDRLIYSVGAYHHTRYSQARHTFMDGTRKRFSGTKKWTHEWDSLFGRWKTL